MAAWTTPTTPSAGDAFSISGRWTPQVANNLIHLHDLGTLYATNSSGGSVAAGDVVVVSIVADTTILTSTTVGDTRKVGVVLDTSIANGAQGYVALQGDVATVNVTGTVARGDALQVSGTTKRAQTGSAGAFAVALTANASGLGTVRALVHNASAALLAHGHTSSGDGGVLASPKITTSILDTNGNEWVKATVAASAVNEPNLGNGATGNSVTYGATGDDTDVAVTVQSKAAGNVSLATAAGTILGWVVHHLASAVNRWTTTPATTGNKPKLVVEGSDSNPGGIVASKGTGDLELSTNSGTHKGVVVHDDASAVNYLGVTESAANAPVQVGGEGTDTHISVELVAKGGNGKVFANTRILDTRTLTAISTAGPATYTPAQCLGGIISRDCNGAPRTDTLPTAANLLGSALGTIATTGFELIVRNASGGATTLTLSPGSGGASDGTMTVAQGVSARFWISFDNVGSGTEAYTVTALGQTTY